MSEALLAVLTRRFPAVAESLPGVVAALESDAPLPFLLRYRRDLLGGLPDATFLRLRAAVREERETERRRRAARKAQDAAGRLTPELSAKIDESRDAAWLEDLARPAHKGRGEAEDPMTPAAREVLAGAEGGKTIDELLVPFCGADGAHPTAVDQRARLVRLVAGLLGEDPDLRLAVRRAARAHGAVKVEVVPAHAGAADWKPFRDLRVPVQEIPGRKLLLLRRGQRMGALRVHMELPDEERTALFAGALAPREGHPHAEILTEAAKEVLDRVLLPAAASEILKDRRRQAERSMLPRLLATLEERLLAPPAGPVPVVAVTPGVTGTVRVVAVDASGRATSTVALHPFPGREPKPEAEAEAAKAFLEFVAASEAKLVAVGGSRRARAAREWVAKVIASAGDAEVRPVAVNEVAAAKWAETEAAKADAPDLPASARVGLSLARSLQDPLVEASRWDLTDMPLDPNQRDLDQGELRRALDECAEACVGNIGADINTAPAAQLARVPGLPEPLAKAIVEARTRNGPFALRADVRHVEGMTEAVWQHSGAFLRVRGGGEPLDATGIHPTGMPVVHAVVQAVTAKRGEGAPAIGPADLLGAAELLDAVDPASLVTEAHTANDVASVLAELRTGTSDPRMRFVAPAFNPGVERLRDVQPGMELTGVVTGLSPFGAFVDVGVRQSGLVHVSEMTHDFVQDPAQVVQPGQSVRVKVLSIDPAKRRIALSMKALVPAPERPAREERPRTERVGDAGPGRPPGRDGAGGGFRRGPPTERARAPLGPERPGTAPRRAMRGRRGGDDRRDGGGMFGRGRRDDRGGRGRDEAEQDAGPRPAKPRTPERDLDPFRLQLSALSAQLGLAASAPSRPAPAPAPAADTPEESKLSGKERRAQRRAQARAATPPAPAADAPAPTDGAPAPAEDAAPANAPSEPASPPPAPGVLTAPEPEADPAPAAERPADA